MDHQTGLLSLPTTVVHNIGRFLAVKDILACSVSCHFLRTAFNDNTIWKKYLPENMVVADFLSIDPCVEPNYSSEGTLTPLCENRVAFIQKLNLINNWRDGNFVEYSSDIPATNDRETRGRRVMAGATYKENYIFFGQKIDGEKNTIELWDISKEPTIMTKLNLDEFYDEFRTIADFLVIGKDAKVNVYKIDLLAKSLIFLHSFEAEEEVIERPPWEYEYLGIKMASEYTWKYFVIDNFLILNKYKDERTKCVFHVWDIPNASKIGSFSSSLSGFGLKDLLKFQGKWLLQIDKNVWDGFHNYFQEFDLETKSFSDNILLVSYYVIKLLIYKSYFVCFEVKGTSATHKPTGEIDFDGFTTNATVYNFRSTQALVQRCFDGIKHSEIDKTVVVNGTFVILYGEHFSVFQACTLDVTHAFPCPGVHDSRLHVNVHGSLFIFAIHKEQEKIQIWDVSRENKIDREINRKRTGDLLVNECRSKLVYFNYLTGAKMGVCHFV